MHDRHSSGFTVIELLVIVVVITVLAVITTIGYYGMQDRAIAASVSNSLAYAKRKLEIYKIDNGAYPPTGNFSNAGINSGDAAYRYDGTNTTYCLTAAIGGTVYSITESTGPVTGGCSGHTWSGGILYPNHIVNGRIDSLSPWLGTASNYWTVADGVATYGDVQNSAAFYQNVPSMQVGAVWYVRFDTDIPAGNTYLSINMSTDSVLPYAYRPSGRVSANVTLANASTRFHIWGRTASTSPFTVDNVVLINLSDIYGAGNEPTAAWCDENIPDEAIDW